MTTPAAGRKPIKTEEGYAFHVHSSTNKASKDLWRFNSSNVVTVSAEHIEALRGDSEEGKDIRDAYLRSHLNNVGNAIVKQMILKTSFDSMQSVRDSGSLRFLSLGKESPDG